MCGESCTTDLDCAFGFACAGGWCYSEAVCGTEPSDEDETSGGGTSDGGSSGGGGNNNNGGSSSSGGDGSTGVTCQCKGPFSVCSDKTSRASRFCFEINQCSCEYEPYCYDEIPGEEQGKDLACGGVYCNGWSKDNPDLALSFIERGWCSGGGQIN
jgi:hypothetical protein